MSSSPLTVTIIPGGFGLVSRDSASLSLVSYLTLHGIKHTIKTSEDVRVSPTGELPTLAVPPSTLAGGLIACIEAARAHAGLPEDSSVSLAGKIANVFGAHIDAAFQLPENLSLWKDEVAQAAPWPLSWFIPMTRSAPFPKRVGRPVDDATREESISESLAEHCRELCALLKQTSWLKGPDGPGAADAVLFGCVSIALAKGTPTLLAETIERFPEISSFFSRFMAEAAKGKPSSQGASSGSEAHKPLPAKGLFDDIFPKRGLPYVVNLKRFKDIAVPALSIAAIGIYLSPELFKGGYAREPTDLFDELEEDFVEEIAEEE